MITNLTFTNRFSQTALISAGFAVASLVFAPGQARADSITFDASPNTGDPANVTITLDDTTNPGQITATVTVNPEVTGNTADITGIFFDVPSGTGPLTIAGVSGGPVTTIQQGGGVTNLGGGVTMQGPGQSAFSVGLRIGESGGLSAPGGVADDFQTTTFTISGEGLSLSSFTAQSFGVRLQSVGPEGGSRTGSSKLGATSPSEVTASNPGGGGGTGDGGTGDVGTGGGTGDVGSGGGDIGSNPDSVQVPEPLTMGGLILGAGGLIAARRRKMSQKG